VDANEHLLLSRPGDIDLLERERVRTTGSVEAECDYRSFLSRKILSRKNLSGSTLDAWQPILPITST
jgi:hypothetical protein